MIAIRAAAFLLALQYCLLWAPVDQRRSRGAHASDAFGLGVLRADGVVIPFANWDGESWSVDWPQGIRDVELPINLESVPAKWWGVVPPPRTMTLWSDGQRVSDVKLERPALVAVLCSRRVGIRTSTRADTPVPPPFEPLPKQGLVVSGPQQIDAISRVSNYSPDVKALGAAVADAAADAEDEANKRFVDWAHPFSRDERRKVPVEIEAVYRVPMDEAGWGSASYIEGVKRYPVRWYDNGCGLMTSISGWIRVSPKGAVKYDLSARISYCDRAGATYMFPLGVLRLGGHTFWVFQTSGYTGEWYSVVRPTSKAIEYHADYEAGRGCPREPYPREP